MMNVFQDIYPLLLSFILIRVGESAFWILLNEKHVPSGYLT